MILNLLEIVSEFPNYNIKKYVNHLDMAGTYEQVGAFFLEAMIFWQIWMFHIVYWVRDCGRVSVYISI